MPLMNLVIGELSASLTDTIEHTWEVLGMAISDRLNNESACR